MPLPAFARSLTRAPGVPVAVIAMLAIGIGAMTTTAAVVDAALFRQPPFDEAAQLTMLYTTRTESGRPEQRARWSYGRLTLLRDAAASYEHVANYTPATVNITGVTDPEAVAGEFVSASYFPMLRVRPAAGRIFVSAEDEAGGAHNAVILSHELHVRRFAADSDLIGRTLSLNGAPLTIIGVMPPGFAGLSGRAQLWMPARLAPQVTYPEYLTTEQNFINLVGRLRPEVTLERARAELAVLWPRVHAALPQQAAAGGTVFGATAMSMNDARLAPSVRRASYLLLAAVAVLYLLACANATNLLLGRATARRKDAAIRAALGASPGQLLRQNLGEGVVLCTLAGIIGVVGAYAVNGAVAAPTDVWGPRNFYGSLAAFAEPAFGARAFAFGALLTAATTLLVAWAPATSLWRSGAIASLREGSRGLSGAAGSLRRPTARTAIVAFESALAVVLVVAGGLMVDSFRRMRGTELGVDAEQVLTFSLRPAEVTVPVSAAPQFVERVLAAIAAVPGVVSATVDGGAPVSGSARGLLRVVGRPEHAGEGARPVDRHYVGPDHFATLGMRIVRGRGFTAADRGGAPKVTVISETAAQRFWPAENAIGKRVWLEGAAAFASPDSSAEVVGVVNDVAYEPLDERGNRASFYTPYAQFTYSWRVYFVRTAGDPLASVASIRAAVHAATPDTPLTEVQTLGSMIGTSWARHRFDAFFYGAFGIVGLALAASGIVAIVAHAVLERSREMGIRLALGATPAGVVAMVVREGMALPALGAVVGLIASFGVTRFLQASLYEVGPADPIVMGAAMLLIAAASLVACVVPALRAAQVDPVVALRDS